MKRFYRDPEVAAISYMILKEQGICVRCLANWAETGRTLCWGCLEYYRLKNKKGKTKKLLVIQGRRIEKGPYGSK